MCVKENIRPILNTKKTDHQGI